MTDALTCCRGRTVHGGRNCKWPGPSNLRRKAKVVPLKVTVYDVPSKGAPKGGFTKPLHPLSFNLKEIPVAESVGRKFLRMTLAERTKFVELFASFTDADWRKFKRWIKKLKGEK